MDARRRFIKLVPALAAVSVSAVALPELPQSAREERDSILGAWSSIHTLPFPPGSFREFLSFAEGGVFGETNSFLYTSSNANFSAFGLPSVINASDGVGTWTRSRDGVIAVVFRKLLFDAAGANFGDLLVNGTLSVTDGKLKANWHIEVVDVTSGAVLTDFGAASSEGIRIS